MHWDDITYVKFGQVWINCQNILALTNLIELREEQNAKKLTIRQGLDKQLEKNECVDVERIVYTRGK